MKLKKKKKGLKKNSTLENKKKIPQENKNASWSQPLEQKSHERN